MSSLRDPFDLLKTGAEMDNVVPFLAPNKVNHMIESALSQPQFAPQRRNSARTWRFAGMGIAACFALLMVFGGTQQGQMDHMVAGEPVAIVTPKAQEPEKLAMTETSTDDAEDINSFSDYVMLETLEPY